MNTFNRTAFEFCEPPLASMCGADFAMAPQHEHPENRRLAAWLESGPAEDIIEPELRIIDAQ